MTWLMIHRVLFRKFAFREFIKIIELKLDLWLPLIIITMPSITITNEDQSYDTFVKLLYNEKIIPHFDDLQCKKGAPRMTRGNKYKKV